MKKLFKYGGIALIITIAVVALFMLLGIRAVAVDKEALSRLQDESLEYYKEKGTFIDFCSSELYLAVEEDFTYDIKCWNDHLEEGVQITVDFPSDYLVCRPATIPVPDGKGPKKFACLQISGPLLEIVR